MNNNESVFSLSHFIPGIIAAFVTMFFLYSDFLFADTITLKDGTVLVGKIVTDRKGRLVFTNSYGVFDIKKKDIVERFETESYEEDVEIHRKLGKEVTAQTIEKIKGDYTAGEEKKVEIQKEEKIEKEEERKKRAGGLRMDGIIGVSGSYLYSFGRIAEVLTGGFSGHIFVDQGIDGLWGTSSILLPGLRVEGGYLYFKKGDASMKGYFANGGPAWTYPLAADNSFSVIFAVLPGLAYLDYERENQIAGDYTAKSTTFTGQSILGFKFMWESVAFFLDGRYIYIYDKDVVFSSVSGELGIGFLLW